MEKLNIKIALANRFYPMNVDVKEEEVIRISASKIEKMLKNFKEKYSVRDDQDLLAMCALQLCVKLEKIKSNKINVNQKIIQDIVDVKKLISDAI
tara:strand:- start:658 stop:942 length:285 start_codon:yes stop_codon:yes gene_type:complete